MWRIAREVGLDENSPYKYLLFARDFAETSVIARDASGPIGFITGYLRPTSSDTLFIWQVGVLERARGQGIARRMLERLVEDTGAAHLEATVTPDNGPSNALFTGFAARVGAAWRRRMLFPAEAFPERHEPEVLIRIGPIRKPPAESAGQGSQNRELVEEF